MKKIGKFVIILSLICIVSWALAAALFFMSGFYTNYNFNNPEYYTQAENVQKSLINGINKIEINSASEDINIELIKGNEVIFNLTGFYTEGKYDKSPKLIIKNVGDEIIVNVVHEEPNLIFGFNFEGFKMYVGIPENYSGDVKITTASGNIKINNFNTRIADLASASGDIEMVNDYYKNLVIKSSSGNLNLNKIDVSENSYSETISGDIEIQDMETGSSDFKSVSGNIQIENSKKINSAKTTSGDIEIKNFEIKNNLNIETISGNVDLDFLDDSSIDVDFVSVSGDLENDFGNLYGGENEVFVKTMSGELKIY